MLGDLLEFSVLWAEGVVRLSSFDGNLAGRARFDRPESTAMGGGAVAPMLADWIDGVSRQVGVLAVVVSRPDGGSALLASAS